MTILSTDLRSLKRRGYNGTQVPTLFFMCCSLLRLWLVLVDRILRQQRDARLAAESARLAKQEENRPLSQPSDINTPPSPKESRLDSDLAPAVAIEGKAKPPSPFSNSLQNLRRKVGLATSQQLPDPIKQGLSPPPSIASNDVAGPQINDNKSGMLASSGSVPPETKAEPTPIRTPNGGLGVTPWSNICMALRLFTPRTNVCLTAKNIEMAINSCKAESSNLLQNREHMQRVKESINDGYCDVSGRKGNLHNIGVLAPFILPSS